jgi:hypothetical protein
MLGRLADYVRKIPESKLDMGRFCGTSRCMLGWAPSVPQLYEWGLRYGKADGPYVTKERLRKEYEAGRLDHLKKPYWFTDDQWKNSKYMLNWFYRQLRNDPFLTGAVLFGITRADSVELFGDRPGTPKTMADELVRWSANKKQEERFNA